MKPWKVANLKTQSQGNHGHFKGLGARFTHRAGALMVLCAWALSILACSQDFMGIQPTPTPNKAAAVAALPDASTQIAEINKVEDSPAPAAETPTPELPALTNTPEPSPTPVGRSTQNPPILYYTQAGDTLRALAVRFGVQPEEITSPETIPQEGLFNPGVLLLIPQRLGDTSSANKLVPDSEIVYSPSALDFDIETYVHDAGGYLSTYREYRASGWFSGAGIIRRVAIENSINPRLLLAILEIQSHWVKGQPAGIAETDFPIGWLTAENEKKGLYYQLSWAVQQLNIGYYWWREGTLTELTFPDGGKLRLNPELNAGTVSLLYLFSKLYNQPQWAGILYGPDGMIHLYEDMFGSPWLRSQAVEPLFPATLTQPPIELPFAPGHTWSFTGGPHSAWNTDGARAALDFAPSATEHGCYESDDWAVAGAAGLVVRSENAVVVIDLDGDGYEQTGWSLMYLHIAAKDRIQAGVWVNLNDPIGHPSCEGGIATGTHIHLARKYNGEWILADGPMPFVLSGWRAHADPELYQGWLTKGSETVYSSLVGSFESRITRPK